MNYHVVVVVLVILVIDIGANANVVGDWDGGVGVKGLWGQGLGRSRSEVNGRVGGVEFCCSHSC